MKIKRFIKLAMSKSRARRQFAVCVRNDGYPASLELRKIYQTIPDAQAMRHKYVRVIDESGEDYLYPVDYFVGISLSASVQRALRVGA